MKKPKSRAFFYTTSMTCSISSQISILKSQPPTKKQSRISGQIVPVQGGHIVRATRRKDRHSKVFTAKGLRDRRVRLSAHTAIQFYDVQDRLGYDRPSKAVDWLIKNAKAAIDQLAELPPWHPNTSTDTQKQPHVVEVNNSPQAQDLYLSLSNLFKTQILVSSVILGIWVLMEIL